MLLQISIIVPVYNHWGMIPGLIAAISLQRVSFKNIELILVDNDSEHFPMDLKYPEWVTVVRCRVPGSYAARNTGIAIAKGDLIVFTDADCLPVNIWLSSLLDCLSISKSDLSLVAGAVNVVPKDWNSMTLSEMYDVALGLPQQLYVRRGYAVTANLLIPRLAFESVGLFDANRFSGGDAEFCRRAVSNGWSIKYCPVAVVQHPARRSISELITKQRRVVGGQAMSGTFAKRILYGVALITFMPLKSCFLALSSTRLSLTQRFKVCAVVFYLRFIGFWELIRLSLGSKPERR